MINAIKQIVKDSIQVWPIDFPDDNRIGFNFTNEEFNGEIWMDKETCDRYWPDNLKEDFTLDNEQAV
jgi:hypothetical protein